MKFFRKIRIELLRKNRIGKYMVYASGEIILVVIGILIAVQINEGVQRRKEKEEERTNYRLILVDLEKDLELFGNYNVHYSQMLDVHFQLRKAAQGEALIDTIFVDYVVMNMEFNPVTQRNHAGSIASMDNRQIRDRLNDYFWKLNLVRQAMEEFNRLVETESRPFLFNKQGAFNYDLVFDESDRTFPPLRGISVIDKKRLEESLDEFLPILSAQRMSLGFYLASLNFSMTENKKLTELLKSNLE